MPNHTVKTHDDGAVLPREDQLAWKIAQVAAHHQQADADVIEMIGNRLIDNAAVAIAAINRQTVRNARLLALGYPHPNNSVHCLIEFIFIKTKFKMKTLKKAPSRR